ncbi:putative globular PEP-CTERM protein [Geminisphaera colitermitum]|uniref:putative globular PEP-CTERM protein n=1 Tax=Geminisphaera colitermitum TaxID=1148786 RepID=UPI0001965162|nr:putative globular PEP-CTERM protein [Geminisphaera colitermitum]
MKKTLIGLGAALALSFQLHAEPLSLSIDGGVNLIMDNTGAPVSGNDGYIITFWYGASDTGPLTLAECAAGFLDADYGSEYIGLFNTQMFLTQGLTRNTPFYAEARIFQYEIGTPIGETYVEGLGSSDFTALAEYWDLIQGTQVSKGVLTFSGMLDPDGGATGVTFGPAELQLSGIKDTPAPSGVPEPSTYAALAGLAILAYAAVRRRR